MDNGNIISGRSYSYITRRSIVMMIIKITIKRQNANEMKRTPNMYIGTVI